MTGVEIELDGRGNSMVLDRKENDKDREGAAGENLCSCAELLKLMKCTYLYY